MHCSNCGREATTPGAKFCEECGTPLTRRCAKCAGPLSPSAKFCPECAHPVDDVTRAAPRSERFAVPEEYTPRHLIGRILESRSALEGERKHVTVLFADLKGSMELIASLDPEEARHLLDPVVEQMVEAIHFYEGTVNQIMGDGIMALFGAPIAHEDHAVRACYAALRAQESVRKLRLNVRRDADSIQIRIGVNSGEVVVRAVGSDLRMDYSAIGQTTHLAARLEQMAIPGTILISAATARLAEGYVQVTALGKREVKGLAAPIEVFSLVGPGAARSRLQAQAARGLTKFVGRTAEVAELEAALDLARQGHGQIVGLIADAGVGKSRLNWEFLHSPRTEGCLILECGCISHRRATAFLPVIEMLRRYFQIEARDDTNKIAQKISGKVLSLNAELEPDEPALLWLLDLPVEDEDWQRLDPQQRRRRALESLRRLLLSETRVQPVILLVEDLHWIDRDTQGLLDALVEGLPTTRLMLALNYRPEYQHGWGAESFFRQIRLNPLGPESTAELLATLLGDDRRLQPLTRRLLEWTDGNPLFLEEIVRNLWETGVLVGERGAYRLTGMPEAVHVAPTVQAIIAARIDRLPEREKRVLQSASVVGTEVRLSILNAMAEGPDDELREAVANLQTAEFLYESRLFPDIEYTFRHVLTRDVAYRTVLQDRRRHLHARVVEAIEREHAGRLSEEVGRLAHHALHGEIWEKAVDYLRQAGLRAHGRWATEEAVAWFEHGLSAVGHLPQTAERVALGVDLRLDLRASLYPLGRFTDIVAHLTDAQRLAQGLGDERREAWVSLQLGDCLRQMGRIPDALPSIERARELAAIVQEPALQLASTQYLGLAWYAAGDFAKATELLRLVVKFPEPPAGGSFRRTNSGSRTGFLAINLSWLARSLSEVGAFEEGLSCGRQGLSLVEDLDEPYSLALACIGLGYLHLLRGEFAAAATMLERGWSATRDRSMALVELQAVRNLALARAYSGRVDEGIELLEHTRREVEARGIGIQEATVLNLLAEAYHLGGRADAARESADRALIVARERGQEAEAAASELVLAEIARHQTPASVEAAERHYQTAATLATRLGMKPLLARCYLGRGLLHGRMGPPARAAEALRTAAALFQEMGMGYWRGIADTEAGRITAGT